MTIFAKKSRWKRAHAHFRRRQSHPRIHLLMQTWHYSIADRLKSKMTALRRGIMQCISIFTLVACAVHANQILGKLKTIILCMNQCNFGSFSTNSAVPEIETHPSSLLVPIGSTAVFECKVRHCPQTCSVYWVINGSIINKTNMKSRASSLKISTTLRPMYSTASWQ